VEEDVEVHDNTLGVLDTGTLSCDVTYTHMMADTSWRLLVADDDRLVCASTSTTQARREFDKKFLHVR
jgi:hypothetical protein